MGDCKFCIWVIYDDENECFICNSPYDVCETGK